VCPQAGIAGCDAPTTVFPSVVGHKRAGLGKLMEVQKVGRRSTQRQWQQRQQRRQQQLRLRSRARAALPRSRLNSRTRLCFLAGAAGRRRCPVPEGHPDAQVRPAARGWGEARAKVQGAAPRGAASPAVSPPPPSLPPTRPPATPRHATQVPNRARHRDQLGGHGAHLEAHVEAAAGGPPGGLLLAGGGGAAGRRVWGWGCCEGAAAPGGGGGGGGAGGSCCRCQMLAGGRWCLSLSAWR
jgi:hypothetical protein